MVWLDRLVQRQQPKTAASGPNLEALGHQIVEQMPYLQPVRQFWRDLQGMREWWLFLLPLLVWVGWRSYRKEVRKARRQKMRSSNKTR